MGGVPPSTFWQVEKGYNQNAAKELSDLFGSKTFDTVKPTRLLKRILQIGSFDHSFIMDFFAGSGTTGHAVIDLNREDGGNRKYILVEQGRYFDSVMKRRIMKVVYSKDWKDGKPKSRDTGVSHMFKYMTLESYEDALDNVSFGGDTKAPDLFEGDEYLLRYMLGFESRDSETFLNARKLESPFDYKLTVRRSDRDDGASHPTRVDLPETFAYLLGMCVYRRKVFHDGDRRYLAYRGETAERDDVAVIWREARGWSGADYERDRNFVAEKGMAEGARDVFVNGDSLIPDARPIEPTFKKLMTAEGV
jgi:adenine-specific DNA-methyltransferase